MNMHHYSPPLGWIFVDDVTNHVISGENPEVAEHSFPKPHMKIVELSAVSY